MATVGSSPILHWRVTEPVIERKNETKQALAFVSSNARKCVRKMRGRIVASSDDV